MADWRQSSGETPQDPYSEMPVFEPGGGPSPYGGSALPPPETPPAFCQIPTYRFWTWAETAWAHFRAYPKDWIVVQALITVIAIISLGAWIGPLTVGFFRYTEKRLRGIPVAHAEAFAAPPGKGLEVVLAGLIGLGALIISSSLMVILGFALESVPFVGTQLRLFERLIHFVGMATLSGLCSIFILLVGERNYSIPQALNIVLALLNVQLLPALLLCVATGFAPTLGSLLLLLGVLVGGPLGMMFLVQAFHEVFPPPPPPTQAPPPQAYYY